MPNQLLKLLATVAAILAYLAPAATSPKALAANAADSEPKAQPNFIFILGEGHGWSSTSVQMDDRVPTSRQTADLTPNLERLASEGMRLSDFYATCPRCTPSRASFFTGISPAKLHMTYVNDKGVQRDGPRGGGKQGQRNAGGAPADDAPASSYRLLAPQTDMELPADVKTTGDVLRSAGYATAHFGKWHVGRASPSKHGFDETDGPNTNVGPGRNATPNPTESKVITDKGLAFIEAQIKAGKPFFLQLSHYGAGTEEEVTPESLAEARRLQPELKAKSLAFAAGMRDMDNAIGRVMNRVADLGIADRTYIIFSTDHGTPGGGGGGGRGGEANAPLSRGKGSVQEGGVRIPFIVRGPGIKPGTFSHERATGMDLLPTLAELAGTPISVDRRHKDDKNVIEGGSLVPVFKSGGAPARVSRPRDEIVIHFPHYDLNNGGPASSIYLGQYKLLRVDETGKRMLFDMSKDWQEQNDLAAAMPDKVKDLESRLDAYLVAVHAQRAAPNPEFKNDATPAATPAKKKGGKGGG